MAKRIWRCVLCLSALLGTWTFAMDSSSSTAGSMFSESTNMTLQRGIYQAWPDSHKLVNLPLAQHYGQEIFLQFFTQAFLSGVTDGEGHSLEDVFIAAERMVRNQRDILAARYIRVQELEIRGQKTATLSFTPATGITIPTEVAASGLIMIYNLIHQYEHAEAWRGVHRGTALFKDKNMKVLGSIGWNLEQLR